MNRPKIVSHDEWIAARKTLLAKEKAFDRQRDALSAERRALPMEKVEKPYTFETSTGKATLRDLFEGRKQLIVYHFMFDPSWEAGCKSCSLLADTFDGASVHLPARDASFVAISRAPLAKLEAFEKRMGWKFRWVSSAGTDFNYDYQVSAREGEKTEYNYAESTFPSAEKPGASVFLRDGDDVFHTYSTYARGLDHLIATYSYLDLTPVGRNEQDQKYGMEWVRHHDKY
jgi:predicted dithiol-disulfide oxidoreductase (DUF899 family)